MLNFLWKSTKLGAKCPLVLSLGFPRLLEAAEVTVQPTDPRSGAGPGRGDPLLGADLAQPAGQDWGVSQPPPGHGHCFHTGIVEHCTVMFTWHQWQQLISLSLPTASLPFFDWREEDFTICLYTLHHPLCRCLWKLLSLNNNVGKSAPSFFFTPQNITLCCKASQQISHQKQP